MSLNVIELNDSAVRVTRDGLVVCSSPGIALVDAQQVLCGAAAQARAQIRPREVYQHFWQHLNELPLPDAYHHCRHHADLAYHHLASVLDAAGRPAEAVLAVPGHYDETQLALLLGITAALGLKVAGLIDTSVAALAGCAPAGRYVVVDMHRHHMTLNTLEVGAEVTLKSVEDVAQAGLARIEAAAVSLIAAALLSQARFDALHEAASAQLLYDELPRWLAQASHGGEVAIALSYHGKRFSAQVAARDFVHVTSMVLASVVERLPIDAQVLAGTALTALPGALDYLAPARALPSDACYRGVAEHRLALPGGQDSVHYVTRLPATRAPQFNDHEQSIARSAAQRAATHVLTGSHAQALTEATLYLHADGRIARAAQGAHAAVTLTNGSALLRANGVETRLNGVAVAGSAVLRAGDHITLAGGRALFIAIVVSD